MFGHCVQYNLASKTSYEDCIGFHRIIEMLENAGISDTTQNVVVLPVDFTNKITLVHHEFASISVM